MCKFTSFSAIMQVMRAKRIGTIDECPHFSIRKRMNLSNLSQERERCRLLLSSPTSPLRQYSLKNKNPHKYYIFLFFFFFCHLAKLAKLAEFFRFFHNFRPLFSVPFSTFLSFLQCAGLKQLLFCNKYSKQKEKVNLVCMFVRRLTYGRKTPNHGFA